MSFHVLSIWAHEQDIYVEIICLQVFYLFYLLLSHKSSFLSELHILRLQYMLTLLKNIVWFYHFSLMFIVKTDCLQLVSGLQCFNSFDSRKLSKTQTMYPSLATFGADTTTLQLSNYTFYTLLFQNHVNYKYSHRTQELINCRSGRHLQNPREMA